MSSHLDYEINKELGECYLFMGDLEKAEDYYRKAAASNGVHPDPYLGLATIAVQRGALSDALVLYRKAADIEAGDKALAGMGLVEMEQGDAEAAYGHLAAALALNPENLVAMNCIVRLGYHFGRVADVVPYLENYLSLVPGKDTVRTTLAGCLITLGRPEEARAHLEQVLASDPANPEARSLYEGLAA
ncbi:tetratricopeptide repeat protein [Nitratidesulfovibrio vulgaris]|uniref:TPR domain protein n=1 Tax=Nitratidesulfovibrio vulgaris (strain ATCC 29579 / DSM 644 / CCUG 34227 / NCIMB 8303 / VKM B-1760 / Hildenborough) TaxID=882 RepID=Q72F96_NITV2|nr:tetratricopeptide repeat protein [Nitratidesulfovibrio vulgaris]AAS94801.1 TPR domain protein [Nitratidesulfovibrio vulgaris str. Hildenborough]ADP85459.1 Tetratricopeptide TPR_1 repeat-containing protein [Nitratidesulfovibrio vulgaris RCH1]